MPITVLAVRANQAIPPDLALGGHEDFEWGGGMPVQGRCDRKGYEGHAPLNRS